MKLEISTACTGHGRCYALASALFDDDDNGYGVLKGDGSVQSELEASAREAALGCPEGAIRMLET